MEIKGEYFVCGTCGRRYPENGECATCQDPLLDARNEEVRQMLIDDDARRAAVAFRRWVAVSMPLGLAIVVAAAYTVPAVNALLLGLPFLMGYAVATAGVTVLLTGLFQRLLPTKKLFGWLA